MNAGLSKRSASIALVIVGLSVSAAAQRERATDAAYEWVDTVYERVLEKALPIESRTGSFLGYRQNRDYRVEELEASFLFTWTVQENIVTVTIARPDSNSLYDQLLALHRRGERSIDGDVLVRLLRLRQWRLSETTCPAIRIQHDRFYRMRLDMRSERERRDLADGVIRLSTHQLIHRFRAAISDGALDLVLTDETHEYVRWAEETLRALDACAAAH